MWISFDLSENVWRWNIRQHASVVTKAYIVYRWGGRPYKLIFTHAMPRPCRVFAVSCHAVPRYFTHSKPHPCHSPTVPCSRESARSSRKYPSCQSYSLTDWYAFDIKLCGTQRGSWKKLKACRSPTCRLWTADANSQYPAMPCHTAPMPSCTVALRSSFQNGMVMAWHGRGMGAVWHVWIKHGRTV
jgi:hypothetical protein